MGDLGKLKVGIGQVEIVNGRLSANEAAVDRMVERAVETGADILVVPASLTDAKNVRIIGLNDSRIDIAGNVVVLEACGETYRIGVGEPVPACDFCVLGDVEPYTIAGCEKDVPHTAIVAKPVGILDIDKRVLAFSGGSAVYDENGNTIARLRDDFEEDFALVSFAGEGNELSTAKATPLDAVVATLKRFDALAMPWNPNWVIGLSGGLDSSVVASLLVMAFGPERVVGYNLATRFNSDATKTNADSLSKALGIPMRNGSIEDLVVALGNTAVQYGYPVDALSGLVLENAQARTRGQLLSTFSALENGVVVNNGNRVEAALGYATLYGDAIGALAPIGDLTKVQLFDLARSINERRGEKTVPENLLPVVSDEGVTWETMPSAELANEQIDPMRWFYHDWLISELQGDGFARPVSLDEAACSVMERYLENKLEDEEVGRWVRYYGLDDPKAFVEDLEWVMKSMRNAAFKRIQAPPKIAIASPATVAATSESQIIPDSSSRYQDLEARIKKL